PTRKDPVPRLEITAIEAPFGEICALSTPWPAELGVASVPFVLHRVGLAANGTVATKRSSPNVPGAVALAADTSSDRPSGDHAISDSVQPGTARHPGEAFGRVATSRKHNASGPLSCRITACTCLVAVGAKAG